MTAPSPAHKLRAETVTLAHGSGGKAMHDLIGDVFAAVFDNPWLAPLEDQARFDLQPITSRGDRLAMTTDSYVVDPLFFPGGDIGKLAVNGTVNDLAVSGAEPLYLTCGMIIEEGLAVEDLRRVARSMKEAADEAGVAIVTGDTKVVHRGAADKLFVNTAGVGAIPRGVEIAADKARAGDVLITNGPIGDHGAAIVDARGELSLESTIESDCQPLNGLIRSMLRVTREIHCLRDATRGGIATVLNEFARASNVGVHIDEAALPVRTEVRGMCEILGLDPLYLASEGRLVGVVPAPWAEPVLAAMREHPAGRESVIFGEVLASPADTVVMRTRIGGSRIVDLLVGDQLPRIC